MMKPLEGQVAVVAGASRGAGRGIALALGEAGATVYVVGRTTRASARTGGFPGTIDDTAEEVTARGGVGLPIRADCTVEAEVAAVFDRVEREQGRLDVLANAVWGAADTFATFEQWQASMSRPFWEEAPGQWRPMMGAGPHAYLLTSCAAARRMAPAKKGLIVGVTDGVLGGEEPAASSGQLVWDLAHICINRLMRGLAAELKRHRVAVVTLMPGFMRTEIVQALLQTEKQKKTFGFERSESTEYLGRAVVALARDRKVMKKSGTICHVADLAVEYGFTDIDGRVIPRFDPRG